MVKLFDREECSQSRRKNEQIRPSDLPNSTKLQVKIPKHRNPVLIKTVHKINTQNINSLQMKLISEQSDKDLK
jgi:hypothetical protein